MSGTLRLEIFKRQIRYADIAAELGICASAVGKKVNGTTEFKISEAQKLHRKFFPDMDFAQLFADETKAS